MIVPKPKQYEELGEITLASALCADAELAFCKKAFKRIFKKIYGVTLADGEGGVVVKYDASLEEEEYKIEGATVYASTLFGAKNGLASIFQLIKKADKEGIVLTETKVQDKPDVDFRAFFADLARQWHDFDILLGYVDMCYLNKIKYFQIHFTDDQSWTLPFKSFPAVATKGRCYTHEEIAYLVEYANEASVEIIPEFEGIGHSRELIKNCPEEFGNEYDKPMNEKIMCIGKPTTFNNVRKMLTEMAEVFKYSRYIHVGCDEAIHPNWKSCHYCRDYMARQGIETTLELYAHFVQKIVDMTLALGRTPIVWEGFHKDHNHLISKDAIVMAWENLYQTAPDLLEGGFKVINAAWKPLYFVDSFEPKYTWTILDEDFNMYRWDNHLQRSAACGGMQLEPNENIIGSMMCQWQCNYEQEHDRVVANLPVFSDRLWNVTDYYKKEEFPNIDGLTDMVNKVY